MTDAGFNQLRDVCREILKATGLLQQNPPLLYHYTDHKGLEGIVSGSCIWATNAKFLNDASEVKYGAAFAISSIDECIGRATYGPWKSALLTTKAWLSSTVEPSSSGIRSELTDAFVVCFCEDPNLLSQWRAYSNGGGYSIEFDLQKATLTPLRNFRLRQQFRSKVSCETDRQRATLKELLGSIEGTTRDLETKKLVPIDDDPEQFLAKVMDTLLPSWLYTVKDPSFEVENEWRLVCLPSVSENGYTSPQEVQFRTARIGLIPYIEIGPGKEHPKLPITSIKCGPNVGRDLGEHAVKLLLRKYEYSGVEVTSSSIPLRA